MAEETQVPTPPQAPSAVRDTPGAPEPPQPGAYALWYRLASSIPPESDLDSFLKVARWGKDKGILTPDTPLKDAEKEVEKYSFHTDPGFWHMTIIILGIGLILSILSAFVLGLFSRPIPDILIAVPTTILGILAGLFAPSPYRR